MVSLQIYWNTTFWYGDLIQKNNFTKNLKNVDH